MNIQAQSIFEDTSYIEGITETLRDLLRQVIKQREPSVLTILDDPEMASGIPEHLVEHALQVIGIWLQLMNIAEENASMRNRREIERQGGPDEVIGSFSHALGQAAALGVEPETVGQVLEALDVGPTITAHPTEAKRVTVLEIHRRIYLKLYELESPRWTPRERHALLAALKNESTFCGSPEKCGLKNPQWKAKSPGVSTSSAKHFSTVRRRFANNFARRFTGTILNSSMR
jgi:phosphoenolpyruvate carboxylase